MNEIKLCELVREYYSHDREFCLYPNREHDGIVQARAVAHNEAITINLEFFDEKYGFQVWVATDGSIVMYEPENVQRDCFLMRDFAQFLYKRSKEGYLVLVYSLFFHAKRLIKNAADVIAAADAYHAANAAHAAIDAAVDAYHAAYTAHVAIDAAATAAYHATYAVHTAIAAGDAANAAHNAAHAAHAVVDAAAIVVRVARAAAFSAARGDACKHIKNALKKLFKFRKLLMKKNE